MFIPSVLIGVIGGLLGSLFTILNLKIHRVRKKILTSIHSAIAVKILRLLEPALVMVQLIIYMSLLVLCYLYVFVSSLLSICVCQFFVIYMCLFSLWIVSAAKVSFGIVFCYPKLEHSRQTHRCSIALSKSCKVSMLIIPVTCW